MKNENQIIITKEQLLKILEHYNLPDYRYSDITLTFDESQKKYQITSGVFYDSGDYQCFKRYFMKKYGYEAEQTFK